MIRIVLALSMVVGLALMTSVGVEAQVKGKVDPKDTKKVDAKESKKEAGVGGIEIYKGKNGFRYRVVDAEGKTIVMPIPNKSWETREEVLKALEGLKETLNKAKPVDVKE